jgi:very-short-patch-repair endonuclease
MWSRPGYKDTNGPVCRENLMKSHHTWCKKSYAETIAEEVINEFGITYSREFRINKPSHESGVCYFIDFYFNDKNIALEIDGQQHYDKDGNLSDGDIRRDNYLLTLGIRTIRIRWEGNNSKQIEIFKNNIINFIKSNIYEQ